MKIVVFHYTVDMSGNCPRFSPIWSAPTSLQPTTLGSCCDKAVKVEKLAEVHWRAYAMGKKGKLA